MHLIDQPAEVRAGEELDAARVDAFLKGADAGLRGEPRVAQFRGGASNLTYELAYPGRRLILRRPPFGHRSGAAHDMLREATVMQALRPFYPYVPRVVARCEDEAVIGCPFYVMERIDGIILRRDLPAGLSLDADDARRLCLQVIDRMVELHAIDPRADGLAGLGRGEGYVRRQIEGWSERYRRARTEDAPDFEPVMAWLHAVMPAQDAATCVIHNDFRFDNVVLDPADPLRVIGVLDWEMATLGDPLMDLANSLAYWIEAGDDAAMQALRRQPTQLPGMLRRDEVIACYAERSGRAVDRFDFYQVYGLFRLAAIAQQIDQRFRLGHARNPEFAALAGMIRTLHRRCLAQIDASAL